MIKSSEKKLVFNKLLNLLKEFDKVCKENNLNYSLYGGTLLGAIRHNGFIPWDDDVDVMMMRKDYDKLKKIINKNVFKDPFFIQSPETDPASARMFMRLRDSNTTSISSKDIAYKMNQGIFIDIFPMDYFPNSKFARKKLIFKLKIYSKLAGGYSRYYSKVPIDKEDFKIRVLYNLLKPLYFTKIITSKKMFKKYEKEISKYNERDCDNVMDSAWIIYDNNTFFNKDIFNNEYENHIFENNNFSIISNYEKLLTATYGDYMTPKQVPTGHGELIQIADIPYEKFIKENYEFIMKKYKSK